MIRSMTGYGKAEISVPDKKITVEIKSLNAKNADINIKLPSVFLEKELEMKQIINDKLQRGKIDVNISFESSEGNISANLNKRAIKAYYSQLREISSEMNLQHDENFLRLIMLLPDTLSTDKPEMNTKDWEDLKQVLYLSLEAVDKFRVQEGQSLEDDLRLRIKNISKRVDEMDKYELSRIKKLRTKLMAQVQEFNKNIEIDNNRFEQELIYYLEKIDISEEKSRLQNHLKYFTETIDIEESVGKKLGFISQEIGREINTLGVKANDYDIQKLVVEMKDELEKIKEQILNIL